jgi:hypothetical protein
MAVWHRAALGMTRRANGWLVPSQRHRPRSRARTCRLPLAAPRRRLRRMRCWSCLSRQERARAAPFAVCGAPHAPTRSLILSGNLVLDPDRALIFVRKKKIVL